MKSKINNLLAKTGYTIRKTQPAPAEDTADGSSHLDEDRVINKHLRGIKNLNKSCVDIAASDGLSMSNTYRLYKAGWSGLAVEYDAQKFKELAANYVDFDVGLAKTRVTPSNVVPLLKSHFVPKNFGFLNLDIDSYDYFVLEQLLSAFKPSLLCLEINEKIPPPIKFTVKYGDDVYWHGDHFYGQSISMVDELCRANGYDLVEVHYNNAFYVRRGRSNFKAKTVEQAYNQGYRDKKDRQQKFWWNEDMEILHTLPPQKQRQYIRKYFTKYKGKYILS